MSIFKKLAGQTALYGLSSIIGRTITFLLVPFYTSKNVLEADEVGIMTELYAYIAFLNILYLFGLETTYFRFATKQNLTEKDAFNNSMSSILLSSISLSGLIIICAPSIAGVLQYPGKESYFIWLALILALDAIAAIPFARLRMEEKAGKFASIKIANILINVFFNFFFLIFCKKIYYGDLFPQLSGFIKIFYDPSLGVEYVFIANFIASLVTVLLLSRSFMRFKFVINWNIIKPMLIYSIPLMFMGFAGMIDEMLSRIILKYMLPVGFYPGLTNLEALGIFGACYKLSMFMSLATQAFRYAADPFFFSQSQNKEAPEIYAKVMKWFIIAGAFIFVCVAANLSIVKYLLRDKIYWDGLVVVPVLLMANLFSGIYYNLSVWYKLTDKTQYGLYITIVGAVITIIFNILLIPEWGYLGSAITTLICYLSISLISYFFGQRYYSIPYKLESAFGYIIFAVSLVILALTYPFEEDTISSYALQFFLVLVYVATVFWVERKNFNVSGK